MPFGLSADKPASFSPDPIAQGTARRRLLPHLAWLFLFGLCVIVINPRGYTGGGYDDARYLAAATDWALHGPVLGQNHWSLRWPVVLPAAGILRLFGPDFGWLMLPGILSFYAVGLVNYFGVRAAAGERAGFLAALGILATPGFAYWATALYTDLMEVALWSAAFWSLWRAAHAAGARQMRWIVAAGLLAGLSVCVRETSIALVGGLLLATVFLPRLPRRAWIAAMIAAAALPTIEYAILWMASGDPIYRLHVDMRHIAIPSEDMAGGVAKGQSPVLNTDIMGRWAGAGPVRVHWSIDTYVNFFLNFYYGQNFVAAAVLALWARRVKARGAGPRGLFPALLALAATNIVWNLYVLALNPSDRMFMPTTVVAAILAAILADRLWTLRFVKPFVIALMVVKLLSTIIVCDTLPNYHKAIPAAQRVAPPAGPIHATWVTHSYLALADPAFRRRLVLTPPPPGGLFLLYGNRNAPYTERLDPGRWRLVRREAAGHYPWTIRIINGIIAALGLKTVVGHADVDVRLFERLPGDAAEPMLFDSAGRRIPGDTRPPR